MKKVCNEFVDISNAFDNVTDLTLCHEQIKNESQYHFTNFLSLKLVTSELELNSLLTENFFVRARDNN
jgi:hypothetical protein